MRDAMDTPTKGALVFNFTDAAADRPLGRGFGLIDDDIHALIEHAFHVNTLFDADGAIRHVSTYR
jgi:hypothetical protein